LQDGRLYSSLGQESRARYEAGKRNTSRSGRACKSSKMKWYFWRSFSYLRCFGDAEMKLFTVSKLSNVRNKKTRRVMIEKKDMIVPQKSKEDLLATTIAFLSRCKAG
jgi:hypothetical protein